MAEICGYHGQVSSKPGRIRCTKADPIHIKVQGWNVTLCRSGGIAPQHVTTTMGATCENCQARWRARNEPDEW